MDGAWSGRSFYGLPLVSEPLRVEARSSITTIHHELTHWSSARTTRLGVILRSEVARCLTESEAGRPKPLPEPVGRLIASLAAPLEGLAMFSELDFDVADDDLVVPHPVWTHLENLSLQQGRSMRTVQFTARQEQIFEGSKDARGMLRDRCGLLRALFADHRRPDAAYYLVGYLWVKAAAAAIRRYSPRLARPAVFLPLLSRLICDHPIIESTWRGETRLEDLPDALLQTISGLNAESLSRLERALLDPNTNAKFDHLNLHSFLSQPAAVDPEICDGKAIQRILDHAGISADDHNLIKISTAAHVHFMSRAEGLLHDVELTENGLVFTIGGDESSVTCQIPRLDHLWRVLADDQPSEAPTKRDTFAADMEERVSNFLQTRRSRRLAIANFWMVASPDMYGVAVWDQDGESSFVLTSLPDEIEFENWMCLTCGLLMSPEARRNVANSIPQSGLDVAAERAATSRYLEHLASDPLHRQRIMRWRLWGPLSERGRRDVFRWVDCPLEPPRPWRLEHYSIDELVCIFDLPGYPGLNNAAVTETLLPDLHSNQHTEMGRAMNKIHTVDALAKNLMLQGIDEESVKMFSIFASPPPQDEKARAELDALIVRQAQGVSSVSSIRLRHWRVNWKALVLSVPTVVSTTLDSTTTYVQVVNFLTCLALLGDAAVRRLGETEARLLIQIFDQSNDIVNKRDLEVMSGLEKDTFEGAIQTLLELGAIDVEDDARIIKTDTIIYL